MGINMFKYFILGKIFGYIFLIIKNNILYFYYNEKK